MGLGNSSGQTGSRRKGHLVKRIKEVITARGYNSIACSPVQSKPACGYLGSMSETFYHNGGSAAPNVNDILYSIKRARGSNKFKAGYYKFWVGKSGFTIEVNATGVVLAKKSC
tara:strand:+ start:731 stop:1069 length:339 start_codon:yes stop_codon:yes gene_type:complete